MRPATQDKLGLPDRQGRPVRMEAQGLLGQLERLVKEDHKVNAATQDKMEIRDRMARQAPQELMGYRG